MRSGRLSRPSCCIAVAEAELGGDDDRVAERRQRFPDDLFVDGAIGFGGIEEGDAALDGARMSLMASRVSVAGP
jgi:hypothetical protein